MIFASPSAVDVYAMEVVPHIGWEATTLRTIGHITEAPLEQYGATVDIMPSVYTMQAVIEEIMKVGTNHDKTTISKTPSFACQCNDEINGKETYLHKEDLIYPIFVIEGENIKMKYIQCLAFFNFH